MGLDVAVMASMRAMTDADKRAAMRSSEERKKHDRLRSLRSTRRATRFFFIPLKSFGLNKKVPCWPGMVFCRQLTTNTTVPNQLFIFYGVRDFRFAPITDCAFGTILFDHVSLLFFQF